MALRLYQGPGLASTTADARLERLDVGASFPANELSLTWQVFYEIDRLDLFQTPFSIGPTPFTGGADYQVAFDGNGSTEGENAPSASFGVGTFGGDTYHPSFGPRRVLGRWARQAYRRTEISAGNWEHRYWIDLGEGTEQFAIAGLASVTFDAGADLVFGNVPWTTGEGLWGRLRFLKVWSDAKTEAVLQAESASKEIVTSAGATNLWGRWPLKLDGNDVSGNNRHLTAAVTAGQGAFQWVDEPDFLQRYTTPKFPKPRLRAAA